MTRTTPELAPPSPNFHTTPVEGCLTGVKFNVHQTQRRDGCSVQSSFEPGHHYHHHFATITITTLPALPSGDAITIEPSNVPNCVSKGKSEVIRDIMKNVLRMRKDMAEIWRCFDDPMGHIYTQEPSL
ncbi:hypothetical protein AVEN_122107-1 [Araneus ventricosus]|uniref:Uncharacterized protein n=1 Tax=Araneus ventricosus TaxID=182803 RepID=A0A4Y2PSQ8_ARAVE|nr:hypothetical protein AVEN_122107-1 [Araneus ventricosus]